MYFGFSSEFRKGVQKLKKENIKLSSKLLELILSIENAKEDRLSGIGRPELLKGNLAGCYSRRIDGKHRLIYQYTAPDKVFLISCYGHYSDK